MLKYILCLLLLFPVLLSAQSREFKITSETVFKDNDGNIITFDAFNKLTSGTGYEMSPKFDDAGKLIEIKIIKPAVDVQYLPTATSSNGGSFLETPSFSVRDLSGRSYTLSELRGKIVVLKFWFTACPPCIKEIPELNLLVDAYRGEEVVFLGMSTDDAAKTQRFLNRIPFKYNIVPNSKSLADQFLVFGYPTHIVIDKAGRTMDVFASSGTGIYQKLDKAIRKAMYGDNAVDEVSYKDVIKDDLGNRIPFENFISMANSGFYIPVRRVDRQGMAYILMKRIE